MVRTIREPNLTTPQLLRVSTSSASSSRRSSGGSPSQPLFVTTKTTYLASSPNRNGSTVKKRAVLGEREENIMSPSQPSIIKSKSKQKFKSSLTPRSTNDLSGLSRFVAKSPSSNLPLPTRHDILSSSPVGQSPNQTFMSRPGSTPFLPRQPMPMQINEDDTLLLNMRPPEMDFSSPGYDLTDDSDVENPRGSMMGRGGLMTPANSQDVSIGSPQRSQPLKRAQAPATLTRNPISRLPTPPSSQSGSYTAALPPTPQAGPSRASRVRARPSPTPPRRVSTGPSEVLGLGDITTEWDTPLKLGEDVSPNPRRKKSPRLSQPGQTPTRGGSLPAQTSRLEVVIPLRARSNTPGASTSASTSNTPATVRPKGKGIVKPRIPNSLLSQSQSQYSRRSSGGSSKSTTNTPAASRSSRAIPSTAPAGKTRRKSSTISPKSRTTPPSRSDRRASVPVNTKTPKGRGRKSSAIAQTPKDLALSGRRLGTLARPIRGSPGDDPLLLKSEGDEDDIRTEGIRDRQGLSLSLNEAGPSRRSDESSPFNFRGNEDDTLLPMGGGEGYFDMGQGWSDDGSESDAGVGEDTFIHVRQKKEHSGILGRLGDCIIEEEQEEEEEEEGDKTVGHEERVERQRSYTPVLPPRELGQIESVEEPVAEEDIAVPPIDEERSISPLEAAGGHEHTVEDMGDVTLEMEGADWEVSEEQIEAPEIEDMVTSQPDSVRERSPSPVADDDVGDVTQEMEDKNWDVSEEDLEVDQDGDVPPAPQVSEVESPPSNYKLAEARQDDGIAQQSEEFAVENTEEEHGQATLPAQSDEPVPDNDQEGDITQEVMGDEWEVSQDDIPQPSVELHQSSVRIQSPFPATHEKAEHVLAKQTQEDISQDVFDDDNPSRTSSPDHVPSLGESEEMGDVTQDMDVLDWDVSEEDIVNHQSKGQDQGRSESPVFEESIDAEAAEGVHESPADVSEEPTERVNLSEHEMQQPPLPVEDLVLGETGRAPELEEEQQEVVEDNGIERPETESGFDNQGIPSIPAEEGIVPDHAVDTEQSRSNNLASSPNQSPLLSSISLTTDASPQPNKQIPTINFPRYKRTTTPSPSPAPEVADISTTPTHSPSFEPRSLRSPSVPKSPFVLIHHRGDLTFTPKPSFSYSNYRSPSPLPPPTPVFSAEERGHAILEEADRALRRLSKLRSLSPLPMVKDEQPALAVVEEAVDDVIVQSEDLGEGDRESLWANPDVVEDAAGGSAPSFHVEIPAEVAVAIDEDSPLQDVEEESSTAGDITVEADNSAWNLSTEEYEIPLRDESDGESQEQEENDESSEPEENIQEQTEVTKEDRLPPDQEAIQQTAEEEEDQDSHEPIKVPERIVLRLVESGIIKLEPESDSEDVNENVPFESDIPPVLNNASSASSPIHDRPSTPSLSTNELRERSTTRSPAPALTAGPSTPSVYPALSVVQAQPESSTPKTAPPASALRYTNSMPQATTSLERLLSQRSGTSKLSQQILPSSPSTEEDSSPAQHFSPPGQANQQSDESVVIRKPRRSLHDELATATATADEDNSFEGDESFRSVVEVSSLDPKAAARAAAILKLNHAYIEHGILPKSKDLASSTKSTSHTDQERRELLNEAELEIVESHRRSRSRSRSMSVLRPEREMSAMSFMTEDYPVPGAFVRTPKPRSKVSPMKRKREILSVHETTEIEDKQDASDGRASDEIWRVKEWKRLEKVYRAEKETWMKEREIKALPLPASPGPSIPGGLVAWARRSTFGTSAVKEMKAREWDAEKVVERFLGDERKEGRIWDRDMLVLRVQAIERRVSKLASSTASASTSITEMQTPASKRTRPDVISKSQDSAVLHTPTVSKSTQATVEPPSTIKRMLGFVWGKSKTKPVPKDTSDGTVFSSSTPANNKGKEKEVLPTTQMREIRPPHPTSSRWTPVAAPPPPPRSSVASSSKALPIPSSTFSRPIPILSRTTPSSSLDELTSITHSASLPSLSLDSTYKRLYPPLNPPISQRSDAIARLFPDSPSTVLGVSSSTSEKNLKELGQIQKKRSGSVKSLVESWEGKGVGIMGGSISGKDKGKE